MGSRKTPTTKISGKDIFAASATKEGGTPLPPLTYGPSGRSFGPVDARELAREMDGHIHNPVYGPTLGF